MRKNSTIIFTWFFISVIFSVFLVQCITEIRKGERIQCFDIFRDSFITPFINGRTVARNIVTLSTDIKKLNSELDGIDTASWSTGERGSIRERLDDIMTSADEIHASLINVNKYVSDSSVSNQKLHDLNVIKNNAEQLNAELIACGKSDLSGGIKKMLNSVEQINSSEIKNPLLYNVKLLFDNIFRYTLFNHDYLRKFEKEMESASVVASTLRPIMRYIRFEILRDAGDKTVLGKNGWMFYKPDVDYLYRPSVLDSRSVSVDFNDRAVVDNPIAVICEFRNQLEHFGIDLVVVIVPGKPAIYPDLINSKIKIDSGGCSAHSLEIMKALEEKGVKTVDLYHPFASERLSDRLNGESLYLRTDTHWKPGCARTAAETVADKIKMFPWFTDQHFSTEYMVDSVVVSRSGDIASMTKLSENPFEMMRINFPKEDVTCGQVFSVIRDEQGRITSRKLYKDDFRKARILILGDSFSRIYQTDAPFGAGWIAQLAFELKEPLCSIVNDGGASTIVRRILAGKLSLLKGKKLVVWEFVERDLRYGADGWKSVELMEQGK